MKNFLIQTTIVCLTVISSIVCINIPTPPEIIEVKCQRRSALLSWITTGEEDVNEFKIFYKTNWNSDKWKDYGFNPPIDGKMRNVPIFLSPWANYTFRVVAVNNAGASNFSGVSDPPCVTEEDTPHKNPDDVYGRGNGPQNLVITWKPMPPIEQNAPGFFYTVYWKRNDVPNEEWHHKNIHDWQQHRLLIENLPKLRPYIIKVEAHNSLGKAKVDAQEVIGFSDEDKPSEEPKRLKVIEIIDGDSAKIQWDAVPPKSIKGHFKGYKVQVWTDSYTNKTEKIVPANTTIAVINIFSPGKINYALVQAFNGAFDGPESNTITLDMPEDVYPDPPSFTWTRTRDQYNKAVIRITLEPNMTKGNAGDQIYIQYRKKGIDSLNKWQNSFKETIEGPEQTSELVNLDFEVFYEVRVAAQSGNLSSFSNISTIDTHSHKWPKPTTTTTPTPPTTSSTPPPIIYTNERLNPDITRKDVESSEENNQERKVDDQNEPEEGTSKTPWVIALVVLVVFISIFVGVFIFIKQRRTGQHQVNRKPAAEQNNTVTTNANNGNGPIRPNEMDSFIVIDNRNSNGSVGHDEGDDDEPEERNRAVYHGTTTTTESHH